MKIKWNPLSRKRSIPKKNMNWKQAKRRFPRLNPFGDADRDGVKNRKDCKPFDKKRQDKEIGDKIIHKGREREIESIKEDKYGNKFVAFKDYMEGAYADEIEDY